MMTSMDKVNFGCIRDYMYLGGKKGKKENGDMNIVVCT